MAKLPPVICPLYQTAIKTMHVIPHLMRNLHLQSFSDKEIAGQARNDVLNNMMSVWY